MSGERWFKDFKSIRFKNKTNKSNKDYQELDGRYWKKEKRQRSGGEMGPPLYKTVVLLSISYILLVSLLYTLVDFLDASITSKTEFIHI